MTQTATRTTRYSNPFLCPDCGSRLPVQVADCPACGLVLRSPLASQLLQTLRYADDLLIQLRAESVAQVAPPPAMPSYPAPARRPAERRGLSALSIPRILLGLGALCLLVAAVIFLAVAWTWLGIGGRTAVLVGLTVVSGGLGVWLAGRGLRVAGETLTTVSLGLLTLDVVGADNAGWLGDLDNAALVATVGGAVLVAALALSDRTLLVAPQLLAALALSVVGLGVLAATESVTVVIALVVLAHAGLVAGAGFRRLRVLPIAAGVGTAAWWVLLALWGVGTASDHLSLHSLWVDGHGVALLIASLMLLVPVPFTRVQTLVSRGLAAGAATMLTATAALPALDEGANAVGWVALAALVGWTAVAIATPPTWRVVPRAPMVLAALPVFLLTVTLALQATVNAIGVHAAFSQDAGVRLGDPVTTASPALLVLGVAGLLLAVVSVLPRPAALPAPVAPTALALAAIGAVALHPVPAWGVVTALVLLGSVLVVALRGVWATAGVAIVALAVPVALSSDVLTVVATTVLVALTAVITVRGRLEGGALLPLAITGLLWSGAAAAGVGVDYRALPVVLVLGVLAIAVPRLEIEVAAGLAALVCSCVAVSAAGTSSSVSLAFHLTLAGVLVTASALAHPGRRELGWLGGLLLVLATWVRLADIGVSAPEAYTLPSAIALLLVGLQRLHNDPDASTGRALTPGLLLATVPSLLWVLVDPISVRSVVLGAACLTLVLVGSALRWNAPLLVGAVVGTLLVLRELTPYALQTPQWALIGVAGTLLTVVGVTWESRLRELRQAASYVERLR
ncbi:hypothetical protein ABLE68_14385 [Nocardioides sp. CN2-186]|uniref:SCO7613 C-terminal domain-containing membrane protein n=1 Tax=Nocardioides tweenelious TaxID=3156607 RepID=UPI0032B35043